VRRFGSYISEKDWAVFMFVLWDNVVHYLPATAFFACCALLHFLFEIPLLLETSRIIDFCIILIDIAFPSRTHAR
jgi:hypothetical protein